MELHELIGAEIVSTGGMELGPGVAGAAPVITVKTKNDRHFRLVIVSDDECNGPGAIAIEEAPEYPAEAARAERFWAWLEERKTEAVKDEHGKKLTAAGFEVWHTGGGCLAWGKTVGSRYFMITEEAGIELTDSIDVGLYNEEQEEAIEMISVKDLESALAWVGEKEGTS